MHIRTGCCYIKLWNFYSKQLDTELVSLTIVRGDNFKYVNLHKNDKENRFLRTPFWSTRTVLSILYFSFERKPGKIETNVNPANHILCISLLTSIVVLRERLYWFREQLYDYGTFMLGYNIPGILTFETSILRNRWTLAVMVVTFLIEAANRQEKSHATGLTNSVARTENGLTSNLEVRYRTLAFHLLDGPTQLITMTARGEPDERNEMLWKQRQNIWTTDERFGRVWKLNYSCISSNWYVVLLLKRVDILLLSLSDRTYDFWI